MGVYSTVNVCVKATAALPPAQRVRIVELCLETRMLNGPCALLVPEAVRPKGLGEWFRALVLRQPLGTTLAAEAVSGYGDPRLRRGLRVVEEGEAGPWIVERAAALGAEPFLVWSANPTWKDEVVFDGGFVYGALAKPTEVTIFNAYRDAPHPRDPPDGRLGSFWDLLSISSKRGPDGRALANSRLVRQIRKSTGCSVTCRTSWW